jgi:uncharacterized membrane protein
MTSAAHLWAIAYDEPTRAEAAHEQVLAVGGEGGSLNLLDVAILACRADGSFTLDKEPLPGAGSAPCGAISLLVGLALAGPLSGYAVDAMLRDNSSRNSSVAGITDSFIEEIKALLKPDTSALLVLDEEGNLEEILAAIRGLGGTVVKTNVDLERAKLIQSTLRQENIGSLGRDREEQLLCVPTSMMPICGPIDLSQSKFVPARQYLVTTQQRGPCFLRRSRGSSPRASARSISRHNHCRTRRVHRLQPFKPFEVSQS